MQIQIKTSEFKKHTNWEIKNLDDKSIIARGSNVNEGMARDDVNNILSRYGITSVEWLNG